LKPIATSGNVYKFRYCIPLSPLLLVGQYQESSQNPSYLNIEYQTQGRIHSCRMLFIKEYTAMEVPSYYKEFSPEHILRKLSWILEYEYQTV
jgi:hypothetical protein